MIHIGAGTSFSHYEIRSQLGAGGMGEVYLAQDLKLRRPVAIKFIARHKEISPAAEKRFLREARAASQLNHPNIITIYEAGETENHAYIVMEYVEGQSLRELILACDLSPQKTLDIALQISDALAEAHEHNVIHRDIKPENILITERGRVKVLDFGLARNFGAFASTQDGPTIVDSLTDSGAIVGTLPYMSPEQLKREPLDRRSDIFSFGIVLFEMMTGRHPFQGLNAFEIASLILKNEEVDTSCFSPALPQSLTAFIKRVLEKDRSRRFDSFTEVKRGLEAVKGELSRLDAAPESFTPLQKTRALSGVNFRNSQFSTIATPAIMPSAPTVLVLPLEAVGSADETSFIGIGLAYSITTGLAKIRDLSVLSKAASAGRGTTGEQDTRAYARALGATILLEGEVMRSGQTLRIMVRLSDVATGRVIWGDQYSGVESDLFKVQDTVCESVAAALRVRVSTDIHHHFAEPPAANLDAFERYSKGRAFLERHEITRNIDYAIQMFEEALKLDPAFALAQAGLGEAYWMKYEASHEEVWVERAIAASDRALILDPHHAQVHLSLGIVYHGTGKLDRAIEEFKNVLARQPLSDDAHRWLGRCYMARDEVELAMQHFQRAISIRSGYWENYNFLGFCYYTLGRYMEAAEQFRRVISIQPDNYHGYNNLGAMYYLLGRYEDAAAMHRRAIEIHPAAKAYSNLGSNYFYLGRYEEAIEAYHNAIELDPADDILYRNLGDALLSSGQAAEAAAQFEKAIELLQDALRTNPASAQLLGRLAVSQAKVGREDEALQSIERAVQLEPHNTMLMYQRAVVLSLVGHTEQSAEYLRDALQHGYSRSEAERDPDLEPLRSRAEYRLLFTQSGSQQRRE
ncbi:MAG: tetratricopeptide repeat protein [Acidobacteria bacterium]|nr:tetratricopeptide repeat protein [Acidobacteriota bacterium]